MHVVKPVVVRTSLADTIIVRAARSAIATSHCEESWGDFILKRNCEKYGPKILLYAARDAQ